VDEIVGAYSTNGEDERIHVIGRKARKKETTRKIKTQVDGYYYDGSWKGEIGWYD
jgi:hypothetical protein